MKIKLKNRKIKNGMISLYLEYYDGYIKTNDGKIKHKRRQENLKLYYKEFPKNQTEREFRKEVLRKAEKRLTKRQNEIDENKLSLDNSKKVKMSFIDYFEKMIETKKGTNKGNWKSALINLIQFVDGKIITFKDIDESFLRDFKQYLLNKTLYTTNKKLSQNSASSYYMKVRACLRQAFEDKILTENIAGRVKAIKPGEPERAYLTIEEIQRLAVTECRYDVLKRAFLFSCLTGMRWSDVNNLKWSDLVKQSDSYKVNFRQKKTKEYEYLDINNQAKELLGKEQENNDRVFGGLRYSSYMNTEILRWCMRAGITKHITFHSGRHSFATMLLTQGVDIYTVSKLLGHKEIKTTQIYAKIIDEKKREAVNKIPEIKII